MITNEELESLRETIRQAALRGEEPTTVARILERMDWAEAETIALDPKDFSSPKCEPDCDYHS